MRKNSFFFLRGEIPAPRRLRIVLLEIAVLLIGTLEVIKRLGVQEVFFLIKSVFRERHMRVLEGNMAFANGVHPLGEGHAATGRHQSVATLHGRGEVTRVGFNLLVILEGIVLYGGDLRESSLGSGVIQREGSVQGFRILRLISRFSRRLRKPLILVAEDTRRANRRHIKTGGRNQRQLGRNIQQLQYRLQRQGVARIAQVRVQAAAGNGISLHTKHRHDISDALLDFVLIGSENL